MICQEAYIELKSLAPHIKHPDFFSVGGYSATSQDGRNFCFDWTDSSANASYDENGYLVLKAELSEFDDCHEEGNLKEGIVMDELTAEFLSKSTLTEAYFECGYSDNTGNDGEDIKLEITAFVFFEWNGNTKTYDEYRMSKKEIERYNREEGMDENFWELKEEFSNKKSVLQKIEDIIKSEKDNIEKMNSIEKCIYDVVIPDYHNRLEMYSAGALLYYFSYCNNKTDYDYRLVKDFAEYCLKRESMLNLLV